MTNSEQEHTADASAVCSCSECVMMALVFGNVHDNVNFAIEAERDPDVSAILSLSASIETLTLS